MVVANRNLLREVRRMAIRAEAAAMRLRGRLVPPRPGPAAAGGDSATRPTTTG